MGQHPSLFVPPGGDKEKRQELVARDEKGRKLNSSNHRYRPWMSLCLAN